MEKLLFSNSLISDGWPLKDFIKEARIVSKEYKQPNYQQDNEMVGSN